MPSFRLAIRCLFKAGLMGGLLLPSPAAAESGGKISFQLNRVSDVNNACRFNFVFRNGIPVPITDLVLELVVFDHNELVDRFVLVKSGSLPKRKTRVRQFDFTGMTCDKVAKILVNEVKACDGDGLEPEVCMSRLEIAGNKTIKLLK